MSAIDLSLATAMQNQQTDQLFKIREIEFLRDMHTDVIKKIYVPLVLEATRNAGVPLSEVELDGFAKESKLAADRLMLTLGFMKPAEAPKQN